MNSLLFCKNIQILSINAKKNNFDIIIILFNKINMIPNELMNNNINIFIPKEYHN